MTVPGAVRVATWNLQWAGTRSAASGEIHRRLDLVDPDVAVLTEARMSILDGWPARAHAGLACYPGMPADGAKVAIVSRVTLAVIDHHPADELMAHNFLAVDVAAPSGPLRVIGVVVRYRQISAFIDQLPEALDRTVVPGRTVLAGDFNLRVPGGPQSSRLLEVLTDFELKVRSGRHHPVLDAERPLIDHIAVSDALSTDELQVWPRRHPNYRGGNAETTDHAGCAITVHLT